VTTEAHGRRDLAREQVALRGRLEVLRAGAVVAAGPIEETLTAPTLSDTFGLPLQLDARAGRHAARLVG